MIEIKDVFGKVLYSSDTHTVLSACLIEAVGKGANLEWANLEGAHLEGAHLKWAHLERANLDYSCWPLHCGSTKVIIDEKIFIQLLYHALIVMPEKSPVKKMISKKLKEYINKNFHRINECEKLK